MLLDRQRPAMAGIKSSRLRHWQVIAKEKYAAPPDLGTHPYQADGREQTQDCQVGEIRRQNPKRSPDIKSLQANAPVFLVLFNQAGANQEAADPEKDVNSQSSMAGQCMQDSIRMRAVGVEESIAGMADHHPQDGQGAPAIQRGQGIGIDP